ncbi:hypothetical protein [Aureimonas pseudogalii]|uniref:Endonuclease/exonuclease/phosphatase domain-containing protein n=1 Tax=Aureimonas pseudogalii TaxID=1744844 RepID=A0A7W6MLZ2_9HYPH|nr:hypothetical protein [Aureimonas pseudogalii]MBB4000302.1 hypothetical protein [Aureimonas pseudogalii]
MPEPNIIVYHWNIQNFGYAKTVVSKDICKAVAENLYSKSLDTTSDIYVGFLLEVKVNIFATDILRYDLSTQLSDTFPLRTFEVGFINCGGGAHNAENIVFFHSVPGHDKIVTSDLLSYKDEISKYIEKDKIDAIKALNKHNEVCLSKNLRKRHCLTNYNVSNSGNRNVHFVDSKSNEPSGPVFSHEKRYSSGLNAPEWYRDGVMITIESALNPFFNDGNDFKSISIGSIHMPGPDHMSKDPNIFKALMEAANKRNLSCLTGDFNVHSVMEEEKSYLDHTNFPGGTTQKKDDSGAFSNTKYDRSFSTKEILKTYTTDVSLHSAFVAGSKVSDHGGLTTSYTYHSDVPVVHNMHLLLE